MTLNWFKVFNLDDFTATGLVSRTATFLFDGIGSVDVSIFQGNETSVLFDDVFLSVDMESENPFVFDGHGVYLDDNNDIWIGYTP